MGVLTLTAGRNFWCPCSIPPKSARKAVSWRVQALGTSIKALASQKSFKKSGKQRNKEKKGTSADHGGPPKISPTGNDDNVKASSIDTTAVQAAPSAPSRSAVLQACIVTSSLIGAAGFIIRQVAHVASAQGWPIVDCSSEISFSLDMWHLELITGLVLIVSSCRYLLLKTWPDFSESSEAANRQVLSSLEPLDYMIVALLPGAAEELLFRGALVPLFGLDWKSILEVAALFGILHLGSGRKYSFAIWATFVGAAYGYAAIWSSSVIVPMASHAINNLIGGVMWRYTSKSSK